MNTHDNIQVLHQHVHTVSPNLTGRYLFSLSAWKRVYFQAVDWATGTGSWAAEVAPDGAGLNSPVGTVAFV